MVAVEEGSEAYQQMREELYIVIITELVLFIVLWLLACAAVIKN
jgi:hypothetical protein